MSNIKYMREICQLRKPNASGKMVWAGHWFNTLISRHFSIYITWLFVKLGINANTVTFLMIPLTLVGVAFVVPHILWLNIVGALLIILAEVFDCVDGEIARWNKKTSLKGFYLDLVSHVFCNAPLSMMCGLHLYVITQRTTYLILAFIAYAMAQCRLGLTDIYRRVNSQLPNVAEKNNCEHKTSNVLGKHPTAFVGLAANFFKKVIIIGTDISFIRLVSFACIFISYTGIIIPMIYLLWFFVVFGVILNISTIISKYFRDIPDMGHTKKV